MDSAAIVLQARMESTRLPGKSLAIVAGRSLLAHCVERLRASGLRVVVATSARAADDPVERESIRLGVEVIRGPDQDVLGRFVMVAQRLSLTHLVRATADNPAVDIDAPRRVLALRRRMRADRVVESGLPYGTAVEAVSADALYRAAALTTDPLDREHVTAFIGRDSRFVAISAQAPPALRRSGLSLTVDTPDDLAWVRRVFDHAESASGAVVPVPLTALIAAVDQLTRATPTGDGSAAWSVR
jgi:spore coat polysaccharide biosynthesis protein SpsF